MSRERIKTERPASLEDPEAVDHSEFHGLTAQVQALRERMAALEAALRSYDHGLAGHLSATLPEGS